MGHARRMMNNRRRLIWEMTKEKHSEKSNSSQHDELSDGEGEVSPSQCEDIFAKSRRDR